MRTDWSDEGQIDGGKSKQKAIVTVQVENICGERSGEIFKDIFVLELIRFMYELAVEGWGNGSN